jgi:hypothetical protein
VESCSSPKPSSPDRTTFSNPPFRACGAAWLWESFIWKSVIRKSGKRLFATKYRAVGVTALVLAGAVTLAGCASASNPTPDTDPATSSAFEHIHGLAFDSGAGAGLVATHYGLYRFPLATTSPVMPSQLDGPQGGLRSDFMGITSFDGTLYASGHPNPSVADTGPNLGLLRSTDAGLSWTRFSSTAAVDYHSLTAGKDSSGTVVLHGLNSITSTIETSTDGGQSWTAQPLPPDCHPRPPRRKPDRYSCRWSRLVENHDRELDTNRHCGRTSGCDRLRHNHHANPSRLRPDRSLDQPRPWNHLAASGLAITLLRTVDSG